MKNRYILKVSADILQMSPSLLSSPPAAFNIIPILYPLKSLTVFPWKQTLVSH